VPWASVILGLALTAAFFLIASLVYAHWALSEEAIPTMASRDAARHIVSRARSARLANRVLAIGGTLLASAWVALAVSLAAPGP
jgi:hypothetical protein